MQLNKTYEERGSLIEACLNESQARLQELRKVTANKRDDPIALKNLRSEQTRVSIANLCIYTVLGKVIMHLPPFVCHSVSLNIKFKKGMS